MDPRATYRLQLHPDFGFERAAALADYLASLGVSHLYTSPYLQAAPGSTHGYDVADPTRVNEELGGEEGHARFVAALRRQGLGQVIDVVPNHLAAVRQNPWWWDVIENGTASLFAPFFDVDWDAPEARYAGLVLLPVLGDHYGRELAFGRITLGRDGGRLEVRYQGQLFPLSPESVGALLVDSAHAAASGTLRALGERFAALPRSSDPQARLDRSHALAQLRGELGTLLAEAPDVGAEMDAALDRAAGDPETLHRIIERQNYRLAHWRAGARDLDYRRFFDVDSLIGARVEDPDVFAATHARVLEWLRGGAIDGLRIDHPDGLRRPGEYLRRLRAAAPGRWIVVEKILEPEEELATEWPVDGTTGYEFIRMVGGLFVDPAAEPPLDRFYREITGDRSEWAGLVRECRERVVRDVLWSDLSRLTAWGVRVCESRWRYRDFTSWEMREALAEALVSFDVYRTYVGEGGEAREEDRARIVGAIGRARARRGELGEDLFELIEGVLLGSIDGPAERELRMRFQQLTGPVMAKAVEDTAFYAYGRFTALNEVGGDPERFGVAPAGFHAHCLRTLERWPRTMLALSTHDTKRSEDVRARLAVLSELPDAWEGAVRRWMARDAPYRAALDDPRMEYFLLQALLGAWPIDVERATAYARKAAREAKLRTSWTSPSQAYEEGLERYVRGLLEDAGFVAEMDAFVARVIPAGRTNALAQKLVQLTAPGIPDLYQGAELWDFHLVDPDNRRPVDYESRRSLLRTILDAEAAAGEACRDAAGLRAALARPEEGGPKLWVVLQALRSRRRHAAAFGPSGGYRPLYAEGAAADHVVAFLRGADVVTVVPRLTVRLSERGGWRGTVLDLPGARWRDRLTGRAVVGSVGIAELLCDFPVALLEREA